MNETVIFLCVVASAAVAADAIVRLMIAPHRRNNFLEDLMDTLMETDVATQGAEKGCSSAKSIEELSENLFRHFEQSAISRNVLEVLALRDEGLDEIGILEAVNHRLAERQKRELPQTVIRKIVMILMGADMIALRNGSLQITDAGRQLNALLHARVTYGQPSAAFVSP